MRVFTLRGRDLGEYDGISCGPVKKVIYSSSPVSYNPICDTPKADETVSVMVSRANNEEVLRGVERFTRRVCTSEKHTEFINEYYMQDRDSRYFNCCRPFDEDHMVEAAHPHTWNEHLQSQFCGNRLSMQVSERKVWKCHDVRALLVRRLEKTGRRFWYPVTDRFVPRTYLDVMVDQLKHLMTRLSFVDAIHGPWR